MQIKGTHKCEHCDSDIEWEYLIMQQIKHSTIMDIHRLNRNASRLHILEQVVKEDENEADAQYEYLCQVRCKKCYYLNEFTYKSDITLS